MLLTLLLRLLLVLVLKQQQTIRFSACFHGREEDSVLLRDCLLMSKQQTKKQTKQQTLSSLGSGADNLAFCLSDSTAKGESSCI